MEMGKTYFLIEMSDEDYYILLTLCRNMNQTKQQFIMDALRTHIQKLQDEWKALREQAQKASDKASQDKGKKEDEK
jgi:hypothetical protein